MKSPRVSPRETPQAFQNNYFDSNAHSLKSNTAVDTTARRTLSLIKTWETGDSKTSLCFDQDRQLVAVVQKRDGQQFLIEETTDQFKTIIGIPKERKSPLLEVFLQDTYANLIKFGMTDHKLYIHQRGVGGLRLADALRLSNAELIESIKRRLNEVAYSSIYVKSVNYKFDGNQEPKLARKITLTLTGHQKFCAFFHAFFSGVGLLDGAAYDKIINQGNLQEQLIKVVCDEPGKIDEIALTYNQARTIELYLAQDLDGVYLQLRDQSAVVIYKIGKTVKCVIDLIGGLAKSCVQPQAAARDPEVP
jgi:hypothetical protein